MELRNAAKICSFHRSFIVWLALLISWADARKEVCHSRPTDLVFVLDGSRSVRPWHFKSTKDAVKDIVDNLEEIGPNSVQIGLIQYASLVKQEFSLGQFQTKEEVNDAIDGVEYMAAGTMTGSALRYLYSRTFQESQGARNRPGVAKVAVIITDGRAQDIKAAELWQKKVKDSGIEIFAIGVGRRISDKDLEVLASEPKDTHKYYVKDFSLIQNLPIFLKTEICVVEVDECKLGTDECDHNCTNTIGSFFCSCRDGYELQNDSKTCLDVKPAYPIDLILSDVTHTSMRAFWRLDEPEKEDSVEYYLVTYKPADGSGETREMRTNDREVILEDLMPGTEYNVSVVSVGRDRQSPSISDTETTLDLLGPVVTITDATFTTAVVEWTGIGMPADSYFVRLFPSVEIDGLEGKFKEVSGESMSVLLDGLEPGTRYTAVVIGFVDKEKNISSPKGSNDGRTRTPPTPEVEVTYSGLSVMDVMWTVSGPTPDRFEIQYAPTNQPLNIQKATTEDMSLRLKDLEPDTDYTIGVTAIYEEVGKEIKSEVGSTTGKTKILHAPDVDALYQSLTTGTVEWGGIGMEAKLWKVEYFYADDNKKAEEVDGANSSVTMSGLKPGKRYTAQVTGIVREDGKTFESPVGEDTFIIEAIPPPRVDITSTGLTVASVSWTAEQTPGGLEPTRYDVIYFPTNSPQDKKKFSTEDISADLTGLKPGTEYTVQVVAEYEDPHELGTVIKSPVGQDLKSTKILPPPDVTITNRTMTTQHASWSLNVNVTQFLVEIIKTNEEIGDLKSNPSVNVITVDGNIKEMTFEDLTPGSKYSVFVWPKVIEGKDETTGPLGIDADITKPAPPVDLRANEIFVGILDITFKRPEGNADSYEFKCVPEDADPEDDDTFPIATTGDLVAQCSYLTPGVKYKVLIRTLYGDQKSDWAEISQTTAVGPIQNFDLSEPTAHTINATWEPPANVGIINAYILRYYPVGSEDEIITIEVSGDVTRYVLHNLLPETAYTATIVPVVRSGHGPEATDTETTLGDKVAIKVTNVGYNTISVEWPLSKIPQASYALFWQLVPDPVLMLERPPVEQKFFQPGTTREIITGVLPGSRYTITIQYVYSSGEPEEATTNATTLAPPPGPVTFTDITEVDYIVHWVAPDFGAKPLAYEIQLRHIDDLGQPSDNVVTVEPENLRLKHDGLSPGTLVNVSVVAKYHYQVRSDPSEGQVTTLAPTNAGCSCQTYLTKQREMQESMHLLVNTMDSLASTIKNLEKTLAQNLRLRNEAPTE